MTCIVGVQDRKKLFIGGDSALTSGDLSQRSYGEDKVFQTGSVLFGVCGLPKVITALRDVLEVPSHPRGLDDRKFISKILIPAIKACLWETGCSNAKEEAGGEREGEFFEGAFLMGYKGKLYRVESNFQTITSAYGFDAVGSGEDIAIGSLHASVKEKDAKKRCLQALEASAINNAGVRPPFVVLESKK